MLEEGLRSPTFSPAEAAQGLLSFVRFELQDGGATAEKRFIGLFTLLCERLFGTMSADVKEAFRHETGGWLARQNRWEIPRRNTTTSTRTHHLQQHNATPTLDMDPVVQLLCGMESLANNSKEKLPTFLEAIGGTTEARRGVRVQYPFYALPKPTQDFLMKMVQSSLDGSIVDDSTRTNAFRLFGGLMRVPPTQQTELRRLQAQKTQKVERSRPLTLSPVGMSSSASSIFGSYNKTSDDNKAKKQTPATPQIMLNMVEYFLITFIRYPLASPTPPTPAPQGLQSHGITRHQIYGRGRQLPYGESVYMHLFRCYLLHYLPVHEQGKTFLGFPNLSNENELFLRIIIELWLCGSMDVMPVRKAAEALLERRRKNDTSILDPQLGLELAFDLVKVKYEPPAPQVQKCLKSLIAHTLKDPNVAPAVFDCFDVCSKSVQVPWCLSPTMTILQPSFYNHVMTSFRHAPIHVTGSPFYAALDAWLLWLEPWNVEMRRKHAASDFSKSAGSVLNSVTHRSPAKSSRKPEIVHVLRAMKSTARSKYNKKWEPFIAANLYLYTAPLALFLRRARELDFSSQYFSRSFTLLQRVFRVYTPDVIVSINRLLAEGSEHAMAGLVQTHGKNLGAYSPNLVGPIRMTSLQNDMHNLLEEVDMQYRKTVRDRGFLDRVEANIEGVFSYFGIVESSTGEERKISQLVEKAKLLASLPRDYTIHNNNSDGGSTSRSIGGASAVLDQVMKRDGVLTDAAKSQVIAGQVMCRPADLISSAAATDSMHGSVKSHELTILVTWTIAASEYLNSRFGHDNGKVIFNLRFLADYRNILVLAFVTWVWTRYLL